MWCSFFLIFFGFRLKRGSMGIQDYSFLRDLQVEFKEVTNRFSLCFWFYLNEASTLPSTILYQVFIFLLTEKKKNPFTAVFLCSCYASQFCVCCCVLSRFNSFLVSV